VFGRLAKKQKIDEAESEKERKEEDKEGVGDGFISWKEQVLVANMASYAISSEFDFGDS
jgi:hypothetical protein